MAKWRCRNCGTEVKGRCRPKACPQCGAPKEDLEKIED
ncbi:MAG: radical SAM protein [candidate division KSB1 bacterium]|nr:radical SAM protein [candidate division KSB1 bacterium]